MIRKSCCNDSAVDRLRGHSRSGVAAVEFAICMPLLFVVVFGAIETSNAVFLQQALTAAAYEAGTVAAAMGGNSDDAATQGAAVLTGLQVNSGTVSISPTVTPDTPIGTTIVVTCTAPLGANTATTWCLGNRTLTATFTIPRL